MTHCIRLAGTAVLALLVSVLPATAGEVHWTPAHELAHEEMADGPLTSGDLDNDGDLDVFRRRFPFWNTGTATDPVWEPGSYPGPFEGVAWCVDQFLTLGDLDGDGDLDLISTCRYEEDGLLNMHMNTGTGSTPVWTKVHGAFDGVPMGGCPNEPSLADIDADGDLDLLVATDFGSLRMVENVGTPYEPRWADGGFLPVTLSYHPSADLGDLDGDMDLDLVSIGTSSAIRSWENVGTPAVAEFVENPQMLTGVEASWGFGVELLDADGDGDPDLLISGSVTTFNARFYLNDSIVPAAPSSWGSIKALYR